MFFAKLLFVCVAVVLVSPQGLEGFRARRELSEDEIETDRVELEKYLRIGASHSFHNYRLSKILKARHSTLFGDKVKYFTLELIDSDNVTKTCDVSTHTRSWIRNGIQVGFKCPNEQEVGWVLQDVNDN